MDIHGIGNVTISDIAVHYGILGNMFRQAKDLPDGTKVKIVVGSEP
jgi:hypothetical protein